MIPWSSDWSIRFRIVPGETLTSSAVVGAETDRASRIGS